jgi:outer membrane biosynthesis protein TonB
MDRALLERMIGAAVLLLLLVVVAPALLEGPDEPASAPEEISAEQPATRVETIVLDLAPGSAQQVDEPVAEPEPEPIAAAPQVAKVAEPPAPKPAPKPASQPVAASGAAAGSFIQRPARCTGSTSGRARHVKTQRSWPLSWATPAIRAL